jgi:hypothetical protein
MGDPKKRTRHIAPSEVQITSVMNPRKMRVDIFSVDTICLQMGGGWLMGERYFKGLTKVPY